MIQKGNLALLILSLLAINLQLSNAAVSNCKSQYGGACFMCEDGYYLADATTCTQCTTNCSMCMSGTDCWQCDLGFFWDSTTSQCVNDDKCTNCQTCTKQADGTVGCDLCIAGYGQIDGGSCEQCPENQSPNQLTGVCEDCGEKCLACQIDAWGNVCVMCQVKYSVTYSDDKKNCIEDDTAINNCQPGCKSCTATGYSNCSECLSDPVSYTLKKDPFKGNYCQLDCSNLPGCQSCMISFDGSSLMCSWCLEGYVLNIEGGCSEKKSCPRGKYPNYANNGECQDCVSDCASCEWSEVYLTQVCNFCAPGKQLQAYVFDCRDKEDAENDPDCGAGLGQDGGAGQEVCKPCSDYLCANCSDNYSQCSECYPGYEPDEQTGMCKSSYGGDCPEGQYQGQYDTQCQPCDDSCSMCAEVESFDNPDEVYTICLMCQDNLVNINYECIDTSCWPGAVFDDGACQDCPENCQDCYQSGQGLECMNCFENYNLDGASGECTFSGTCPAGQIVVGSQDSGQYCTFCPNFCATCSYNETSDDIDCLTCQADHTLDALSKRCSKPCDSGQYFNTWTGDCEKCMTGASKCYYSESKMGEVHLECSSGFTLSEGTCQPNDAASCPEGTYYDGENSSCQDCSVGCRACVQKEDIYGFKIVKCTTCLDAFIPDGEFGQYCAPNWELTLSKNCKSDEFLNFETNACEKCSPHGECDSCFYNALSPLTTVTCQSCIPSFQLINGECKKDCPPRKYGQPDGAGAWTCEPCSSHCLFCDYDYTTDSDSCLVCANGYYPDSFGSCQKMSKCPGANQYRYLTIDPETAEISESDECLSCPNECNGCVLVDQSDIFSGFKCKKCKDSTYIRLPDGSCLNSAVFQQQLCQAGKYNAPTGNTADPWKCEACPSNCDYCTLFGEVPLCMMCAEGYYLNSESGACDKLNDCGAGLVMYIDGDTQVCRPCESMGCSKCTTDDPTNPYYDYCLECNAGLELNPMMGVCVKKVEKELDVGTVCAPGSFALVVPADGEQFVVCPSCPPGALGCAAVNATDIDNLEVKISACQTGLRLQSDFSWCSPFCDSGQFYVQNDTADAGSDSTAAESGISVDASSISISLDTGNIDSASVTDSVTISGNIDTNSEGLDTSAEDSVVEEDPLANTFTCVACAQGCVSCIDSENCDQCDYGYVFDENKVCVPDDSEGGDSQSVCPPGSDYNSLLGTCDCYGETEIFDATNYECVDVKDALGDCSIGEFKNAQGGCTKCQTWPSYDTNTERCVVCTGPMPSDCLMCGTGYFLNDNNQCQACASGCNYCFDEFSCMECSPGYMNTYQWSEDGSSLNQVCRAKCFTGQLPSVSSFFDNNLKSIPSTVYYSYLFNNGILLNDEQNTTLYFPPGYLNYVQDATNFVPAVAVDWIRNIYDISTVPWKTEKGKVTYGGSLMTLQCEFCLTDCEDCGEGSLLLQDTHTCVFLENCPPLYVRDETKLRSCKPVSADDFFSFVVHLTESEPGVYRLDKLKPLQAQVFTSKPDDTTLVFLWAVTKVKNTKTKKEESIAYMKTLIDTNDQDTVKIPFEKLKPDLVITLCNRATFSGTTIENCIDIATKPSKDVLDITELNVPASAVTVTPDSGTSGSQVFTVVGDFTDTLEKQKTSDTYFDFSMNAYLQKETNLPDYEKTMYQLQLDNSDNTFKPQFTFYSDPVFDQDEEVSIDFCLINLSDQHYCTKKSITIQVNAGFNITDVCAKPANLEQLQMCASVNDQLNGPKPGEDSNNSTVSSTTSEDSNAARRRRDRRNLRLDNFNMMYPSGESAHRVLQTATADANTTRDLSLGFYQTLERTKVTTQNVATFTVSLRKTVTTYVDRDVVPKVIMLLLKAVPFVGSQSVLSEITTIVDYLQVRVDLLTFLQKSTLENAVKESFKQLSLSKVDFSTPYVDADSTLIKSVAYFIDKKDQASVATGKLNFRNIWSNKTIAAPTVDLSVGLFAEARIVTASLSDRMIEKKNKSITSLNTLELHVYTQTFTGQTDFTVTEVDLEAFAKNKVCFDMTRPVGSNGNCAWFNSTAGYWEAKGCVASQNNIPVNSTLEFMTCCCPPQNNYAVALTGPQGSSLVLRVFFSLIVPVLLSFVFMF